MRRPCGHEGKGTYTSGPDYAEETVCSYCGCRYQTPEQQARRGVFLDRIAAENREGERRAAIGCKCIVRMTGSLVVETHDATCPLSEAS